jgi:nucleoside-diphosphate-sugar epimerase
MTQRVLITGHRGYIGSVMTGMFTRAGHEVVGIDNDMFDECLIGDDADPVPSMHRDVRDIQVGDLEGFDAICHLAGISNDPVGDLSPDITYEINHRASVRLAQLAVEAGVERFVFSSSCSIYGASPGGWVDEESEMNPVTPYGWSKLYVEQEVSEMASDDFSPVYLRNATAYGMSPRLRADLVVNNLTGYAHTRGEVFLKSDGRAYRPLIHIEDISRAFLACVEAPREAIHDEVFNVGSTEENYLIRDVAGLVEERVPGSTVTMSDQASADIRNYRVNCYKIHDALPGFSLAWDVPRGIDELEAAYAKYDLTEEHFLGPLIRIEHIKRSQAGGSLDGALRVIESES